jgi:bifunctional pyridoxal-dependent enzyme with beta-cystathionase and maltose regulon repressor activities
MPRAKKTIESKRDRFERIAQRRTNQTLKFLRLLGNLADRRNYEYSDLHVQQIFAAIDQEIRIMKSRFKSDTPEASKQFKFSGE